VCVILGARRVYSEGTPPSGGYLGEGEERSHISPVTDVNLYAYVITRIGGES